MAPSRIEDHFDIHRIESGIGLLLFLVYSPIGLLLLLIRILFCVQLIVILAILPKGIIIRQWILRICSSILGIFVFADKQENLKSNPKILIANSISELDSLVIETVEPHMLTAKNNSLPSLIQWLLGYHSFENTNADLTRMLDEYYYKTDVIFPALIFPEESTTNGKLSLLKFSASGFHLAYDYQPIVLTAKRPEMLAVKLTVLNSSFWNDLLWTFFVPYTIFKVRYLPALRKEESSSAEDFAKGVRKEMSGYLGLQECMFDASDKKEFIKRMQRSQPEIFQRHPKPLAQTFASSLQSTRNSKLEKMVRQVKNVLPQIPQDVIRRDLAKSKSVDITLSNFLEGKVMYLPLTQEEVESERKQLDDEDKQEKAKMKKSMGGHVVSSDTTRLSYQERKRIMIEEARRNYLQKHPEFSQ